MSMTTAATLNTKQARAIAELIEGEFNADDDNVVQIVASDDEGHLCEIQVAHLGNGELNVIIFGSKSVDMDPRGNTRIHVWPQAKVVPDNVRARKGRSSRATDDTVDWR
jgi:hypothetical protein